MKESILALTNLSTKNVPLQLITLFNSWEDAELVKLASKNTPVPNADNPDVAATPTAPTQDQQDVTHSYCPALQQYSTYLVEDII